MSPRAKLLLLTSLYLSQGLPYGFFTQALPVMMREMGRSLPEIGLASLLALPWALKFLWAPLVDRYGSRRAWIVPLQLTAVAGLGALAFVEDPVASLPIVLAAFLVTNLLAATQDVATDGLAVDLLAPEERGMGNGVQVAGYRAGMIVGGGALLVVFGRAGWEVTFLAMAAVLALSTLPVLWMREPPRHAGEPVPFGEIALGFVRRPGMGAWLGAVAAYKAGESLAGGMVRPFLVDAGLGMEDVGWMLGTAGFAAGLLGALLGGWGVGRFGRREALVGFGLLQALGVGLYVLPAAGFDSRGVLWAVCTLEHFLGGAATASLFAVMMDACRLRTAATDYTVQASLVVVATGTSAALSGFVAQTVGWPAHFALSAAGCLLGVWVMHRALGSVRAPAVA
jgi:PAT family beta-lactamase induction signal transducer AmpG